MNTAWLHPAIMIASALAGLGIGIAFGLDDSVSWLIEPFLVAMLFSVFLSVDFRKIRDSFMNVRFLATALAVNFVWTPLFAFVLGILFFNGSVDIRIGLIMLLVTPCTDWYLVFTALAKGNVPLSSSILPLNLILQIVLLPVYLFIFTGQDASFDMASMLKDMAVILAIPILSALAVKICAKKVGSAERAMDWLNGRCDNIQLTFLCLAIAVMFAAEGAVLESNLDVLVETLVPLLLFFAVNYVLTVGISKAEHYSYDDNTSLTFTSLARNSPLSLAIAVAVFPDRPLVMLILVIGPLIELPVLSMVSSLRLRLRPDGK